MNENLGCNFYLATHPKLSVCQNEKSSVGGFMT